ncbi:MAG: alanine racemase [Candidatus Paceibacterota bacterium]|jgi:alanine racemase
MRFLNVLRRYRQSLDDESGHLLRIAIEKNALLHNVSRFNSLFPHHTIAAVLKSNAYGHGLIPMGRFWDRHIGIGRLVVDSLVEAELLRNNGVAKSILILGHVPFARIKDLSRVKPVVIGVNSFEQAVQLVRTVRFPLTVHIKVDTGMHRQGVLLGELTQTIEMLGTNSYLRIGGLMSHLADADGSGGAYTSGQVAQWRVAVDIFRRYVRGGELHFSATAGTRYVGDGPNTMIRAGIGLYGFDTTQDQRLGVRPALSLYGKIVATKKIPSGAGIGYNVTFRADHEMTTAIVPCGYYEGVPRALSNKGFMYYRDTLLPIIGRVSMNMTTVDISAVDHPLRVEDEVEVFSADPFKKNSITQTAAACDTIPYEILVRLAPTIRRVIQ